MKTETRFIIYGVVLVNVALTFLVDIILFLWFRNTHDGEAWMTLRYVSLIAYFIVAVRLIDKNLFAIFGQESTKY